MNRKLLKNENFNANATKKDLFVLKKDLQRLENKINKKLDEHDTKMETLFEFQMEKICALYEQSDSKISNHEIRITNLETKI